MGAPGAAGSLSLSSFRPLQLLALAGFVISLVGTALPWVKAGGESAAPWSGDFYKGSGSDYLGQLGALIKQDIPIDAIAVLVIAVVAVYIIVAPMMGRPGPAIPFMGAAVIFGGLMIALGVVEYLHIKKIFDDFGLKDIAKIGTGVYVVIAGGIVTIVGAFLDQQQQAKL